MTDVPFGCEELSVNLGGGIKHPSFVVVEGGHGSGKTALIISMARGFLDQGYRAVYISTQQTVKELLRFSTSIGYGLDDYYAFGMLRIYSVHGSLPVTEYGRGLLLKVLARWMNIDKERYDALFIDSLTEFMKYSRNYMSGFISQVKTLEDKTVVLTVNPEYDDVSIKASADTLLTLKSSKYGILDVKILNVVKLWGRGDRKTTLFLGVDENGIRVWPLSETAV